MQRNLSILSPTGNLQESHSTLEEEHPGSQEGRQDVGGAPTGRTGHRSPYSKPH